jgi:hypothetical protein
MTTTLQMIPQTQPKRATAVDMIAAGYRAELRGQVLLITGGERPYRVDPVTGYCACPCKLPCKHLAYWAGVVDATVAALSTEAYELWRTAQGLRVYHTAAGDEPLPADIDGLETRPGYVVDSLAGAGVRAVGAELVDRASALYAWAADVKEGRAR